MLERVVGFEPTLTLWKSVMLPLTSHPLGQGERSRTSSSQSQTTRAAFTLHQDIDNYITCHLREHDIITDDDVNEMKAADIVFVKYFTKGYCYAVVKSNEQSNND